MLTHVSKDFNAVTYPNRVKEGETENSNVTEISWLAVLLTFISVIVFHSFPKADEILRVCYKLNFNLIS